jgi:predicted nucleic acid-binding protein
VVDGVKAVLDTSVVLLSNVRHLDGELAISAVTLGELHFGVLVAADPATRAERLRRVGLIERSFDPLPVDETVARCYGRLAAHVAALDRQPRARAMDLLIAATAYAHGARLYTANAGDLHGLEDLVDVVAV